MIEEVFLNHYEHPVRTSVDYHFMIDVNRDGFAELHASKRTGSGWFEYGLSHEVISSTKDMARQLSDTGYLVVISWGVPDPSFLPRGYAQLRRVK